MVGFYLTLPLVFIGLIRLIIAIFNYFSRPFLPNSKPDGNPLISVLISAINTNVNIENLLQDLINQTYQNIEVIVYDNESTDTTIVSEFCRKDKRFKIIRGDLLPEGWLEKNYACHKLVSTATGDYLMFLDTDVRLGINCIEKSLAYIQHNKLVLLSILPKQKVESFGKSISVPIMQWILLTLIPLKLKSIAIPPIINQILIFEATSYKTYQVHEKFKSNSVEDNSICKSIKKLKLKMSTLLGSDDISCSRYKSYDEAIQGFSKNVYQFFGSSTKTMISFVTITTLSPILIILFQPYPFVFLYLFSIIFARMLVAALCEQSTIKSVLLLPLQQYAFLRMVYISYKLHKVEKLSVKSGVINITNAK